MFDWKAEEYGWSTEPKARLVAGADQQRTTARCGNFAPTVAVSRFLMLTAMACDLDLDLCHYDIDQTFVQSGLEGNVFLSLAQGCGRLSRKM